MLVLRTNFFLLLVSLQSLVHAADWVSRDEVAVSRSGPELTPGAVTTTPIYHQPYYIGEREQFGYAPKFALGTVSFDLQNVPFIVADENHRPGIHTLNQAGEWIELDFTRDIKQAFPDWNGVARFGPFDTRRISFDNDGDAYFIVAANRSNLGRYLLLHSRDRCRTWDVHALPAVAGWYRLEVNDSFNQKDHPPTILAYAGSTKGGNYSAIFPRKNSDGTLTLPTPVQIATDIDLVPPHSGDANYCISYDDKVHFVWLSATSIDGRFNNHFSRSFDRATQTMGPTSFVGTSMPDHGLDNHCLPAITVDQQGFLHVILGSHHDQFKYVRSIAPGSVDGWTVPEAMGVPKGAGAGGSGGSYTYASLNMDSTGRLHCVSRWAGDGYRFSIVHQIRGADGTWQPHRLVVRPFRAMYGVWYHKVSIDRKGRLYLYYINYANQLNEAEVAAYNAKWPEDNIVLASSPSASRWFNGVKAKDPVILKSTADNTAWTIATTPDFASDIDWPPVLRSTSPADEATDIALDANLVASFDEAITAGTSGNIELWETGAATPLETFPLATSDRLVFSAQSLTIDPTALLELGKSYHVFIDPGAMVSVATGNAFAGIADATAWNFTADSRYASWIAAYGVTGALSVMHADYDGDGIANGLENYFGTDPKRASRGMEMASTDREGRTFKFTHPKNANPASDIVGRYRWSTDLASWHASGETQNGSSINFETGTLENGDAEVTATESGEPLEKLFITLEVTAP